MLRFSTAGESHGEALVALLSGMPAGLAVDLEFVNRELWRRQQGYGRGGRMRIERDAAHILSGVRHGKTIGSPIAIELANKDWQNWIEALLRDGSGFCDAVLFVHAFRAIEADDRTSLRDVAELAAALVSSKERQLETVTQGNAFVDATRKTWPCAALETLKAVWDGPVAYPVGIAVAARGHAVPLEAALAGYIQALVANWVSAGVRLIPLGQTYGLRVVAALEHQVAQTAARARSTSLDDMGSALFRADLASMRHETQYTRLFRS